MSLVSNGFIIVKFNLQYHNIKKNVFLPSYQPPLVYKML